MTLETETKGTDELGRVFNAFMQSFETYKETNDRRLSEVERRGGADPLTEERLRRIDDALDEQRGRLERISVKSARPALERASAGDGLLEREHRAAFDTYVRSGSDAGLRALEGKAMSAGVGSDGGFVVTPVIEEEIGRRLAALSPIRSIASVRAVSSGTFKKPYRVAGPAVGWVAEQAARPVTNSPTLSELTFPTMELYAMPSATQTLLDDAAVDIDRWLVEEIELAFATQEGTAFVTGDGVSRPKGFLNYTAVPETGWTWGNLGYIPSGAAGAFAASNPSDPLIDLVYALKAGYRQNASFVMNRKVQATVRKFKDSTGNYIWQPPVSADGRATLLGFPIVEAEDMPDVAANSLSIAFGDFRRGYLIVDRMGTRVLRDPYSAKPYVLFYTTKRVGGGVQDFDAIKLLRFAAS